MESPTLSLSNCVGVDSPPTILTPCINLGEFEEDVSPLEETFCSNRMTVDEFNAEAATATEKALKELIEHLEGNPSTVMKLMQKRKQEELENCGLASMIKSRVLKKVQGDKYKKKLVTLDECNTKIEELSQGMMMVYGYSQESRGRRFSKRLAARQELKTQQNLTPVKPCCSRKQVLKDKTNIRRDKVQSSDYENKSVFTSPLVQQLKRPSIKTGSAGTLVSVHEELVSSNPLQKLCTLRQTSDTPLKRRCNRLHLDDVDLSTPCALKHQEPLMQTFFRVFEEKFRKLRSPSPAANPDKSADRSVTRFSESRV